MVDVVEAHRVGDHAVDLDLAGHVLVDHAGEVGAAADAAEGGAAPDAAGDELEGPGRDLLAGTGDADDHRLAPALVAALEGGAHDLDVADALERVVDATVRQIDDDLLDRVVVVGRVDEVRGAEGTREVELGRVDVDRDDPAGLRHHGPLDHGQADAAQAEDRDRGAGLNLGGVQHRADAGRDAAAQQADLVERRGLVHLRGGDLGDHRVLGEGRGAHVVVQRPAASGEPGAAVRHHALALGAADRLAEIRLARRAELALAAFRRVERDHVVAGYDGRHAGTDLLDDRAALVAEDGGEEPLRVGPGKGVGVRVADTGGDDADEDLSLLRPFDVDLFDLQWLARFVGHGGSRLHRWRSSFEEKSKLDVKFCGSHATIGADARSCGRREGVNEEEENLK